MIDFAAPSFSDRLTGTWKHLLKDSTGNTLAIAGAAMVPLAGMIGSGVDLSRAYMAQSRLQTACDAASLAGRRAMTNDTLSTAVTTEANKFFNFNFDQGRYQAAAFTPVITKPESGTVQIDASTTIPTSIMHMFGKTTLPISVTCQATLNYVNTDVVLVLDVTGSMDSDLNGTKKIVSMREAVMAFYDELAPVQTMLEAAGMRLRYSIVPYSSTVNVGNVLYDDSPGNIVNNWAYQSRDPIHFTSSQETYGNKTVSECGTYNQSKTPGGDVYPATEKIATRSGAGTRGDCVVITRNYNTDGVGQFSGNYLHVSVVQNVSQYKTGSTGVLLPTRKPGTNGNSPAWAGCIEERETLDTISAASGYSIPAGAYDLNIDYIPNNDDTRWKPLWPEVSYRRNSENDDTLSEAVSNGYRSSFACPAEAKRLDAFTRNEMQTYVNSLTPTGSTYHDYGMIWGARMISSAGVFGDSPDTFNGMPVARHLIFMTDGELAPTKEVYSMYGQERYDQRITSRYDASGQYARHEQRFKMICNAVKGKQVSIWAIAFGTEASDAMKECASNASQVAVSTNKATLIAKFREIGKAVGALRLGN